VTIFCVFAGLVVLGLAFAFAAWDGSTDRYCRAQAARRGTHPAGRKRERNVR
jgi:hypothetical protein